MHLLMKAPTIEGYFHNDVEVKITASVDSTKEMEVNTRAGLKELLTEVTGQVKKFRLIIYSHSTELFNLSVHHNQHLIPTNFVYKYFNRNNTPITKHLDQKYQQQHLCYFTGQVDTEPETIVSLDLCNKIKGVIDYPSRTYHIKTVFLNLQPKYFLSMQRDIDNNNLSIRIPHLNNWLLQQRLARTGQLNLNNISSSHFTRRFSREMKPSGGLGLETYLVEVYVVLDHSLYLARNSSIEKSIEIGFKILNYAAAMYRPLNIYLTVVGIEVWSNGNKISYDRSVKDGKPFLYATPALRKLMAYREEKISPKLLNDNIQLISNETFDDDLYGLGSSRGMCSYNSGGINRYDPIDYTNTAATLVHEMAHAFYIRHVDDQFYEKPECYCHYRKRSSFHYCIMLSSVSKFVFYTFLSSVIFTK